MPTLIQSPISSDYQSILDVFLLQGLVNYKDYQSLKDKFTTNTELESFLLKNRLLSIDSINRAYSIIYKLPFVDLKNLRIDKKVLALAQPSILKKLGIAPFALNNEILSLALAKPGNAGKYLSEVDSYFKEKVKGIDLYITCPADIESVVKQYGDRADNLLLTKTKYPTVFLKNQNISKELINLIPNDFSKRHHLVIFAQRGGKNFLIATDQPDNPETLKAVKSLAERNNINLEIFATSPEEINRILNQSRTAESAQQQSSLLENLRGIGKKDKEVSIDSEEVPAEVRQPQKQATPPEKAESAPPEAAKKLAESENKVLKSVPKLGEQKNPSAPLDPGQKDFEKVSNLLGDQQENIGDLLEHDISSEEQLQQIRESAQVPKIVAAIISYALFLRASDVHMEPSEDKLRVRYRIDGILQDIVGLSKEISPQIVSRIKILGNLKLDENRIPQDGRFDVFFKHRQVDIRVSTLPTVRGEKVVMRLLDKSQGILSLEDLGMVGRAFNLTLKAIKQPYGIIASTGPTGSGKSTTLYAILNRISVPGVNIVTLEDPVEYEIAGVNQCQIKPKIGFTFAEGLRSILRQDPNIIMVGEIRDAETANMATHAALTGHLVLTTLHTNDAAGSLPRLINMGVEPFLITSSINVIIAQRLVRRICPKCREEVAIPESLKKQIEKEISNIPKSNREDLARVKTPLKFYQGRGCGECTLGFKGRLGIFEALNVSSKIEEMVISRSSANDIANQAIAEGMITMRQDGVLKALDGLTALDEVFRVTSSYSESEAIKDSQASVKGD